MLTNGATEQLKTIFHFCSQIRNLAPFVKFTLVFVFHIFLLEYYFLNAIIILCS